MNKMAKYGRMYKRYIPFITSSNDKLVDNNITVAKVEGIKFITTADESTFEDAREAFIDIVANRGFYSKFDVSSDLSFLFDGMCVITSIYGSYNSITSICLQMTYTQKVLFDTLSKVNTIYSCFVYNEKSDNFNVLISCADKHDISEFDINKQVYLEHQSKYTYKRMSDAEFKLV